MTEPKNSERASQIGDDQREIDEAVELVTETLDVFHRGAFHLVQPALKGHRSGVDAMILASCVPTDFNGRLLDMGSGAGAAGLAVASRCKQAFVTLVERSSFMAEFARKSVSHPLNNALASRLDVLEADVSLHGKARVFAGLADNNYDFAIMNPPFNERSDRQTPDPLKAEAHVMPDNMFEQWIRTAAAVVRPGGSIAIIARPGSMREILEALAGRFGHLKIVPVQPRPNAAAIRMIFIGTRASRAGLAFQPALIMHHEEGNDFSERADAINNGAASLL